MATTKSTRGKTKTAKATAAAGAKTAKTPKSTKPPKTAKTAKPAQTTRSRPTLGARVRRPSLNDLLVLSAVLFLVLAGLAGWLMADTSYPITLTHLTSDVLRSQSGTVFVSAQRPWFDVELRWVVVAVMLLSTIAPVLYLTRLKRYYRQSLTGQIVATRWLDLMLSMALMMGTLAVLAGITDWFYVKFIAAFAALTCLLGWLAERQNARNPLPAWSAFGVSLLTGGLPWLALLATHLATWQFGMVRSPWYVYAVTAVVLVGFLAVLVNQLQYYRRSGNNNYKITERNYLATNLLTKSLFAIILIIGLAR